MPRFKVTITETWEHEVEAKDRDDAYEAYHNRDEVISSTMVTESTESIEPLNAESHWLAENGEWYDHDCPVCQMIKEMHTSSNA